MVDRQTGAGGEKGPLSLPPFPLASFQLLYLYCILPPPSQLLDQHLGQSRCCVLFAAQMPLNVLNSEQHGWCTAQSPEAEVKISASQWSNRELSWFCH